MRKLVDDIPTYSEEGRDAIELLHLDYVSFFFYFEDDHHESVYERLIEKLFPKINGVVAVICLGGKKSFSKSQTNQISRDYIYFYSR